MSGRQVMSSLFAGLLFGAGLALSGMAAPTKVIGFLVGQVMKATQGKANPGQVNQILQDKLS